ncbi:Nuclear apoptosis-inducing factor 1 [Nibea albiflora]|uniref:Nuclear apoptosis-inducing factor 1 n=1 Tax=Nibea albiflora TaxID=240163 RepID=A0ACB7F9I8_NIBAL|nr:Nuclear apoptosis-inducing factor 1 [Nibea albiflora]
MMRRSQEAQAFAQERQALALEGTQAALLALVQMLRPALKDLRKFLQSGTEVANPNSSAAGVTADGAGTEEQKGKVGEDAVKLRKLPEKKPHSKPCAAVHSCTPSPSMSSTGPTER